MGYAKNLAYKWDQYLESCDLSYRFDMEDGSFIIPEIAIDNALESITVFIRCRESDFRIWCVFNQKAPVSTRDKIANLLTRINYAIAFGHFTMDYSDGEMGFDYSVDFEDSVASMKMLKNALSIVFSAAKSWGDAILEVSTGKLQPAAAFSKYS